MTVGHAAGERDKFVTVEGPTESIGSSGEPEMSWAPLFTAWMSRQDLDMREQYVANQITTPYMARWKSNYRAALDPDLLDVPKYRRIVYRGRVYNIVGASVLGTKAAIELLTQAHGVP